MMQSQQGQDYVPDESRELELAERIITAYVNNVPGREASFRELRELPQRCTVHPGLVMAMAKRFLQS